MSEINKENMSIPAIITKNLAEIQKDAEKKRKRKETVRAYYLKNQERIKEKARQNYWKKLQEKERSKEPFRITAQKPAPAAQKSQKSEITGEKGETSIYSIMLILFIFAEVAIIFWKLTEPAASAKPQSAQSQQDPPVPPPSKRYREFDIGDGRKIRIPINWID